MVSLEGEERGVGVGGCVCRMRKVLGEEAKVEREVVKVERRVVREVMSEFGVAGFVLDMA